MTSYTFEIPGAPVPKARPRASRRGKHIVMYTPTASKNFEFLVRTIASKHFKTPLKGAIKIEVHFLLPRPKNMFWKTKPMPREHHTKRPDLDNLVKSAVDGMNEIVFHDDSQVVELFAKKSICSGNESPKTIILIRPL